ncbi:MAG: hypothetical protein A2X82_11675 [Geobacteraceae bacterium GWC2_55_20]|nr:MAG: hypothetical protein A2X82_11675 [Geobacteraceae bacterium GWC2_55_20]OGU23345.1 MAG: hypothetical protein A2X85_17740 [Geobacteraceae bacterium GWF2_54_21]HCE66873.1 hypothetical protein [Geobacter sp.]
MHQITSPSIKLHTTNENQGTYLNTLTLNLNGNNYHLQGGTKDTIYVFTESIGIYVLTINKALGYMGLNSYMTPEPDPINSLFLHNHQEISEHLGNKWESLKAETIVKKLIQYLY